MLWTPKQHYNNDDFETEAQLEEAVAQVATALFGPKRIYLNVKKLIGAKGKINNVPGGYFIDLSK